MKNQNKTQRSVASGTQSIRRAIFVLRLLAEHNETGLRLTDAVKSTGLNKATTHRLLTALVNEGLAAQDERTRNYYLGFDIFALGIASSSRYGIAKIAAPSVARLAEISGDTVWLAVRSADEAVCVAREIGAFPIKTMTYPPGDRRPLGIGSGSLALLAFQNEDERERLIQTIPKRTADTQYRVSERALREQVAATRKAGFASLEGVFVPGMKAISLPIFGPGNTVEAALAIASIDSRMSPKRCNDLLRLMRREIAEIENALRPGRQGLLQKGDRPV